MVVTAAQIPGKSDWRLWMRVFCVPGFTVHTRTHAVGCPIRDAARKRPPPVIRPEPFDHEGGRVICYPGDERHSVREQALPGPTRLYYRNKRFEPVNGFDGLFE